MMMQKQPFKEMLWDDVTAKFNFSDMPYTKFGRRIYVFNNPECSKLSGPISSCHQSIVLMLL